MEQAGANTNPMRAWLNHLKEHGHGVDFQGLPQSREELELTLRGFGAPPAAARFTSWTITSVRTLGVAEVAAIFTFGREDVIPMMFKEIVKNLGGLCEGTRLFEYYLDRHIELDSKDHAPLAIMLASPKATVLTSR